MSAKDIVFNIHWAFGFVRSKPTLSVQNAVQVEDQIRSI